MTKLSCHHDVNRLPPASKDVLPVRMYELGGDWNNGVSYIGSPIIDKLKRLGTKISPQVMDFLSIALAVTAADTFVQRSSAADGWARQLTIQLPLCEPERWEPIRHQLESAFNFLSGDMWKFEFVDDGFPPPNPYQRKDRFRLLSLKGLDSVCLFSGGLDSAVGVIDLMKDGVVPLLVSHSYKGDKTRQNEIATRLNWQYSRLALNAHPVSTNGITDITMRTRSCTFLAFGAIGASAVQTVSQKEKVDLFVPENGFISLNAPLTPRRIGSLSTRTTHPHFIGLIQSIFDSVEIPCTIRNPYQFKTKGEMVTGCKDQKLLAQIVDSSISCSHWKRSNQQCGVCVPCIVRRSALHAGGIKEQTTYLYNDIKSVLKKTDTRDDLLSMSIAIKKLATRNIGIWISDSGPLPIDQFVDYKNVFCRGLDEVRSYLEANGAL